MLLAAAAVSVASGAVGQSGLKAGNEEFLDAIREQRANEAIEIVNNKGRGVVNYRGLDGSTALTLSMQKRSMLYVSFLLQNGADPNLPNKQGETALMIAARLGYLEGVTTMLSAGAKVDAANRHGETALIIAVQNRHVPTVRRLLEAGANPNIADSASGFSAREYAQRDSRTPEMLRLIDSVKPRSSKAQGPKIN